MLVCVAITQSHRVHHEQLTGEEEVLLISVLFPILRLVINLRTLAFAKQNLLLMMFSSPSSYPPHRYEAMEYFPIKKLKSSPTFSE